MFASPTKRLKVAARPFIRALAASTARAVVASNSSPGSAVHSVVGTYCRILKVKANFRQVADRKAFRRRLPLPFVARPRRKAEGEPPGAKLLGGRAVP